MDVAKTAIKLSFRSPRTLLLKQLESVTIAASFSPSGLGAFVPYRKKKKYLTICSLLWPASCLAWPGAFTCLHASSSFPLFAPHFLFGRCIGVVYSA